MGIKKCSTLCIPNVGCYTTIPSSTVSLHEEELGLPSQVGASDGIQLLVDDLVQVYFPSVSAEDDVCVLLPIPVTVGGEIKDKAIIFSIDEELSRLVRTNALKMTLNLSC